FVVHRLELRSMGRAISGREWRLDCRNHGVPGHDAVTSGERSYPKKKTGIGNPGKDYLIPPIPGHPVFTLSGLYVSLTGPPPTCRPVGGTMSAMVGFL